jgi:hypothetical protein
VKVTDSAGTTTIAESVPKGHDWGYIENTRLPTGGYENYAGLNIVYLGSMKWWSHGGGAPADLKVLINNVAKWNGGARLQSDRLFPRIGLSDY